MEKIIVVPRVFQTTITIQGFYFTLRLASAGLFHAAQNRCGGGKRSRGASCSADAALCMMSYHRKCYIT